jgi:putative protease
MNDARIELLAPAKDGPTALAAIQCGADAVYLGAERFSAREAAGNSLATIRQVTDFAHQYYARVYVALNTLLYDDELPQAEKMIGRLDEIGIDGLIVQDVGLLELDLPPLPLIASTQMHNATAERVKFWQDVGFSRAILARELTLDEIRDIRRRTSIELECFVHGALCVGASGQCYLSYALGARSGNRGQCAQPCRRAYSLHNRRGETLVENQHLLSLKDLNLSEHLEELIDAGVSSFKIEGRLKDMAYVVNTVSYYRQKLDAILTRRKLRRRSSGTIQLDFTPDPAKTFNRGFTDYGFTGHAAGLGAIDTPKSIGEFVGTVAQVGEAHFTLDRDSDLHCGDGICFLDPQRNLTGTVINGANGRTVHPQKMRCIRAGLRIYRNYDHLFAHKLATVPARRRVGLSMQLQETAQGLVLVGTDEDTNRATVTLDGPREAASKEDVARQTILTQLTRLGNTLFDCSDIRIETDKTYFLPVSQLNAARRELVQRLLDVREANRGRLRVAISRNDVPFLQNRLTYMGNVLNAKAREFYRRHGVQTIEPAAESGLDLTGRLVMTTKYCLRKELGLCRGAASKGATEPLILRDEDGREYAMHFLCGRCGMEAYLGTKENTL